MNTYTNSDFYNYNENFYKHNFFHCIDTNSIVDDIKKEVRYLDSPGTNNINVYEYFISKDNPSPNEIDLMFSVIFDKIFAYNDYIFTAFLTDRADSNFFGLPGCIHHINEAKNYLENIKTELMHHCITSSFIYRTAQTNHAKKETELSAPKDKFNHEGFFSSPEYNKKIHKHDADSNIYQRYKSMYNTFEKSKSQYYSTYILNTISCKDRAPMERFTVKAYKKNLALFLLEDSSCSKVSKQLIKKTSNEYFIKVYQELAYSCNETMKNYSTLDKFLFSHYMEYFFGFNTVANICSKLDKIKEETTTESNQILLSLDKLLSDDFTDLLYLVLECPAVCARDLLLEYVLFSLTTTKEFSNKYFDCRLEGKKIHYDNSITNIYDKKAFAHKNFKRFFSLMNTFTIPLLENIWMLVTEELFKDTNSNITPLSLDTIFIESYDSINNKKKTFKDDYMVYLPSSRDKAISLLYRTLKNTRFEKPELSIPLKLNNQSTLDTRNFYNKHILNLTNYYS